MSRGEGWVNPLEIFFSVDFLNIIGTLLVAVVVAAHLIWLVERRSNPDFPKSYLRGVWDSIWYTTVTLTTVGYGDRTARTTAGRVIALVWMFTSLFLVANFTANMTTHMTLTRFQGLINGEEDLPGKRIATVTGSTAADYLQFERLPFVSAENIDEAIRWLHDDQVDAIVYDSPVLLYHASGQERGRVEVVGSRFDTQNYAVAIPFESADREQINLALLEIYEDGTYDTIAQRWFGDILQP